MMDVNLDAMTITRNGVLYAARFATGFNCDRCDLQDNCKRKMSNLCQAIDYFAECKDGDIYETIYWKRT